MLLQELTKSVAIDSNEQDFDIASGTVIDVSSRKYASEPWFIVTIISKILASRLGPVVRDNSRKFTGKQKPPVIAGCAKRFAAAMMALYILF